MSTREDVQALLREAEDETLRFKIEIAQREAREAVDRITYQVRMAMWGCDLQACLLGPTAEPVPMPPRYGAKDWEKFPSADSAPKGAAA